MPRELSEAIETLIASPEFRHSNAIEIQLPFTVGDPAPIVIRAASMDGLELLSQYDFLIFTYRAFLGALGREPTSAEQDSWDADLQAAFEVDTAELITVATGLIDDLFLDSEYTDRLRTDDQFIGDLYRAYLGRVPDTDGFAFWLGELSGSDRDTIRTAFPLEGSEFTDRISGLNQPHAYAPDVREMGAISLSDGVSIDGGSLSLQNLEKTYSVPLSQPTRQVYPAPTTFSRVFIFSDDSMEVDPLIVGFAEFTGIDGQAAKLNFTSDTSRQGLNVVKEATQRCSRMYKGPGCDSPDPSPTCSLIFDDAVNGCAAKLPAPQIIDPDPPNNQPSFNGTPAPTQTSVATGLTVDTVGGNGWPADRPFDPNSPLLKRLSMFELGYELSQR